MSKFPKVSDWSEKVYSAGARGFNFLVDFEKEMWRVYPDTRPYNFGKFSEDDINSVSIIGWKHLQGGMFDVDDWNSKVGLRFGLTVDASDNVLYGGEYVMLMPRDYRESVIYPERLQAIKRIEQAADDDSVFVHPSDPEYNKMKDAGREIARTEKAKVQVRGTPEGGSGEPEKPKEDDNW
jgi:hypothetical protein